MESGFFAPRKPDQSISAEVSSSNDLKRKFTENYLRTRRGVQDEGRSTYHMFYIGSRFVRGCIDS